MNSAIETTGPGGTGVLGDPGPIRGGERARGAAQKPAGGVTTTIARTFESGDLSRADWDSLVSVSKAPVYLTFEWQSTWWKHFGAGRLLHIVLFHAGERLVGIAPLFAEAGNYPGALTLRLIGSGDAYSRSGGMLRDDGPSDYLDVLVDPAHADGVAWALTQLLEDPDRRIERVDLVNLLPGGSFLRHVLPGLDATRLRIDRSEGEICPSIEVRGNAEAFVGKLDASTRRRFNQALKLLRDDSDGVSFRENDFSDWDTLFGELITLHQRRWNNAGFPGLFFDERQRRFQNEVIGTFRDRGWLWLSSLSAGGKRAAVRIGFKFHGRIYDYLSGFDETSPVARRRPGIALLLAMVSHANAEGIGTLDMLRGDEKYKFEMNPSSVALSNVSISRRAPHPALRRAIVRTIASARLAAFLIAREAPLIVVQVRTHGLLRGLPAYLKFRFIRLTGKFGALTPKHSTASRQRI